MLDMNHHLYKLSESIDWVSLEQDITRLMDQQYESQWRLVSGCIYLQSFYDLTTADLMEKWANCVYHRFFFTGEVDWDSSEAFPLAQDVLEHLSLELAGEGYDAMIRALRSVELSADELSSLSRTIH